MDTGVFPLFPLWSPIFSSSWAGQWLVFACRVGRASEPEWRETEPAHELWTADKSREGLGSSLSAQVGVRPRAGWVLPACPPTLEFPFQKGSWLYLPCFPENGT